jgi:Tol biopolymer transport system component
MDLTREALNDVISFFSYSFNFNTMLRLFYFSFGFFLMTQQLDAQITGDIQIMQPQVFEPGLISSQHNERDMAISPDGQQLIYTLGNHNSTMRVLIAMELVEGRWQNPSLLPFSGAANDIEPFFHPDGKQLFFASNRHDDERKDYDIFVVNKKGEDWGKPQRLSSVVNTTSDEFYPAVASNGNLYYTATRENGIGKEDIHLSRFKNNSYQKPLVLSEAINSPTYEFNAYISPDENFIIFSSYGREDDMGGGDLYLAQKNSLGEWQTARRLNPGINSTALDYCPFVDLEGGKFYFTSQRSVEPDHPFKSYAEVLDYLGSPGNGMGDIYVMDVSVLKLR